MSKRKNPNEEEIKEAAASDQESSSSPSATSGALAQMFEVAGRVASAYRSGAPLKIEAPVGTRNEGTVVGGNSTTTILRAPEMEDMEFAVAGIMAYDWIPTLGVTRDGAAIAPVNMAAKEQYSFIRKANSGSRNYEASDLLIYELALDSLYGAFFNLVRAYGVLNNYQLLNAYYPKAIVTALGFNYDDLVANAPAINFYLNNFSAKMREFAMPTTMRLFTDHMKYNSVIYMDGDISRAQLYILNQKYYWSYEKVDEVKGLTAVDPHPGHVFTRLCTFASYKSMMDRMLSAFMNSSDVALISGDIVKAYGDSSISVLPSIPIDYVTPITKDYEVLTSIMNADITPISRGTVRVEDDRNGNLRCEPAFDYAGVVQYMDEYNVSSLQGIVPACGGRVSNLKYINVISDAPTAADVVNATRFRVWVEDVEYVTGTAASAGARDRLASVFGAVPNIIKYKVGVCGTEILVNAIMYHINQVPTHTGYIFNGNVDGTGLFMPTSAKGELHGDVIGGTFLTGIMALRDVEDTSTSATVNAFDSSGFMMLSLLSQFDWHHPVQVGSTVPVNIDGSSSIVPTEVNKVYYFSIPYQDVQNAVPIGRENIEQLHAIRLFSNFYN